MIHLDPAAGPLRLGLLRMVRRYPFHALLINRWRLVETEATETLGVRLAGDLRVELLYNAAFVLSVTADELVSVLVHEVHHVLFGHLTLDREDYPDETALLLAAEVTVNEFIVGPLPGRPILLSDFPQLPPRESTRRRYQRLASRSAAGAAALDDHSTWATSDDAAAGVADTIIAADAQAALAEVPADLRDQVAQELTEMLESADGQVGDQGGRQLLKMPDAATSTTAWAVTLRRFVRRLVDPVPTLMRPSRRLPHLVGIVPGRRRSPGKPRVLVVLDTSGSMIVRTILAAVRSEVDAMAIHAHVTVVECDAEIQREYEYDGSIAEIAGGGGTSFTAPLDPAFLAGRRIDAVVYVTDGMGSIPVRPPPVPVVWCLVGPNACVPAPWGWVVRVPDQSPQRPR